jgi:DNA polymerase-3 subunit gamma/tau
MLSTNAFNALLKTLEEPPAHVKFIFATTEIRKVPVTVLSRCQRFDLRRIEPDVMISMLQRIAKAEGAEITEEALGLITRAAEGSARDAQSLLDQAISHGAGETTADQVRAMLGLADRGRVLDLFDLILRGNAEGALGELSAQHAAGADPMAVLRDLAEVSHWVSVIKITPVAAEDPTVSPDERSRGLVMAERLAMRVLSRMWQMLLTALEEVGRAPNAMMAAEMVLIRLTHVADLPTPDELIRKLQNTPVPTPEPQNAGTPHGAGGGPRQSAGASALQAANPSAYAADTMAPRAQRSSGATASAAQAKAPAAETLAHFARFEDVLELIRHHRDVKLLVDVETSLKLVSYSPGRIEFEPTEKAPRDLAQRLGSRLQTWTGQRWAVSIGTNGASTIAELRDAAALGLKEQAKAHPLVQAVLVAFPKAQISDIRTAKDIAAEAQIDALPEVEDEWDPFDDE